MIPLGDASRKTLSFAVVTAGINRAQCFRISAGTDRRRRLHHHLFDSACRRCLGEPPLHRVHTRWLGARGRVTLVPVLLFIGFWFVTQLFSEIGSGSLGSAQSDGVVFGAVTDRLFEICHTPAATAESNAT